LSVVTRLSQPTLDGLVVALLAVTKSGAMDEVVIY
jgi:hypothetical protein